MFLKELKEGIETTCKVLVVAALFSFKLIAQTEHRPNFIGVNPSVTVEPFYEKGELDLNIFPLVYQRPLNNRFDIRFTSIVNLGIRNTKTNISHLGLETALPIFFKAKENKNDASKGFYAAPVISLTRNLNESHNNIGIWAEPGYNILFENKFALSIGVQYGTTYFKYDNGKTKWANHFGVKVVFGKWLFSKN